MSPAKKTQQSVRLRHARRAATIHDVAARAGVSVATVSRVLNDKGVVREVTSDRVREVARDLRYSPNIAARSLSIRRSHTIGVVLPEVHGEFFSEVIRGIDVDARRSGYHLLVSGSHSDRDEMLEVLDAMRGRVDGLIVMSPDVALAAVRDQLTSVPPVVLLNSTADGFDSITIDNYGGAFAMMTHLGAAGHSRVAFIKGPEKNADAAQRLRGYRRGLRRIGASREDAIECEGDFSEQSGYDATRSILAARRRPSAIFAANDSMAVGSLAALSEAGYAVPDEMAVVGFDDIPIARYLAPPLTTVRVEIAQLGRRAFDLLFRTLRGGSPQPPLQECIPTTLVVRQSCGALKRSRRARSPLTQIIAK